MEWVMQVVHRNLSDIEIPYFIWRKTTPKKKGKDNTALDTETVGGRCFLISDSDRNTVYINDLYTLLTYLNSNRYRKTNNWFYNLTYDTNAVLKYLSFNERKEIAETNKIVYEDYQIEIIPDKLLKIGKIGSDDKAHHFTSFYDLAQFYNKQPLKKLASQTHYDKVDVEDINELDETRYLNDPDYQRLLNDRVEYDCLITKELADQFTAKIEPVVIPSKYLSKASIARKYFLDNLKKSLKLPNKSILQASLNAYHAGMIESCKMGLFKDVTNIDINSAYPYAMSNLYDVDGAFKNNHEYEPDSAYSFYFIEVDYYDDNLSPLWFNKRNMNYHPTGKLLTWVAQPELEFFMSKGFDFKIKKAYHIMKSKNCEKPFCDIINNLYERRLEAKKNNDPIQQTYKIIANSAYGVTLNVVSKREISDYETDDYFVKPDGDVIFYKKTYKATNMFNPVFGAYITALTRVKLFIDFYKYLDKIISINTDGIYLIKSANPHVSISNKLGDYSRDKYEQYVSIGSGRYFVINKDGYVDNSKSRFRSVANQPSDIYNVILESKNSDHLTVSKNKPIKLKESVINKDYHDKFNEFRSVEKTIYFRTIKRYWFDQFEKIDDIFDKQIESRPFDVCELN